MSSHICLRVHFVWSTLYRKTLIQKTWQDRLYAYIGAIILDHDGVMYAIGGTSDHIHLYASLPATLSLAKWMETIKTNSSRWIKETFHCRDFAWQYGYGAFSVSPSLDAQVCTYIQSQEEHHKKKFSGGVPGLFGSPWNSISVGICF